MSADRGAFTRVVKLVNERLVNDHIICVIIATHPNLGNLFLPFICELLKFSYINYHCLEENVLIVDFSAASIFHDGWLDGLGRKNTKN